jgi:hypothetical protein
MSLRMPAISVVQAASKTTVGVTLGVNVGVSVGLLVAVGEAVAVGTIGMTSCVAARQARTDRSREVIPSSLIEALRASIMPESSTGI